MSTTDDPGENPLAASFHSSGDLRVPVHHARALKGQLEKAGVAVTLVEVQGATHVWSGPELEEAIERSVQFFDQHLRPTERPRLSPFIR